jgi:hypothetical protein
MTAPMARPWKNLPIMKHTRRPVMSVGRYETYMMATPIAERKELMARVRRRPILSFTQLPTSEPAIPPMGEAMFQRASHVEGRIHLPS